LSEGEPIDGRYGLTWQKWRWRTIEVIAEVQAYIRKVDNVELRESC